MRKEMLMIGSALLLFVAGCSAQGATGSKAGAPAPTAVQGTPISATSPVSPIAPAPATASAPTSGTTMIPAPAPTSAPTSAPTFAPTPGPGPVTPSGSGQAASAGTAVASAGSAVAAAPPAKPVPPPGDAIDAPDQPKVLDNPTAVTMADNGATVLLSPGGRFLLNLGNPPNWEVSVADQTILARVPNVMVIRGAQGIYRALTTGTTTLSAVGTFPCQTAQVRCMIASPLFRITVEVKN